LNFACHLRLPPSISKAKKKALVDDVIVELGLKECADTLIGDPGGDENGTGGGGAVAGGGGGSGKRGISGGERRRVSAGIQLLTNPSLLLCDEVTSGLDAFTAFELMKTFVQLAKTSSKTIIISIHQPRSEIFQLLVENDGVVCLLTRGDVIYSGPIRSILSWFDKEQWRCPLDINPFDFIVDLSMVDVTSDDTEAQTIQRRSVLVSQWRLDGENWIKEQCKVLEGHISGDSKPHPSSTSLRSARRERPSFLGQVGVLTARGWTNQSRDTLALWGCLIESIFIGVVTGGIFFGLPQSTAGIRSREAALYTACAIQS
jgi:hypothetical protein